MFGYLFEGNIFRLAKEYKGEGFRVSARYNSIDIVSKVHYPSQANAFKKP